VVSLAFAKRIRLTSNKLKTRKTVTLAIIVVISNAIKTIRQIE
jgi:hypothetical protein